ncbi:hypothetical protein [Paenibacillus solanacearum]|uniref:hypothetical protein n=1 Tax=Paenibacillus solanacearum TaxID=2048548 RepID=UPI001C4058C9|nr:hypothetical protein [Paenibacillus solanacearum]
MNKTGGMPAIVPERRCEGTLRAVWHGCRCKRMAASSWRRAESASAASAAASIIEEAHAESRDRYDPRGRSIRFFSPL